MDSISGDSHVIPTSFPRSKICVDSIYETDSAEVRYPIISKGWACVLGNCMNQVWDDFGSGWVIFSMDGSFGFRDSTVFHRRFPSMRLLCNDSHLHSFSNVCDRFWLHLAWMQWAGFRGV